MIGADRIIIVDADDTILKFDAAFTAWMVRQGNTALMDPEKAATLEELFGLSVEDATPLIREFYRTPEFSQIEPLACAADIIPQLSRQGYGFVCITACENDPVIEAARRKNIKDAFGIDFIDVILSGLFVPNGKAPFLRRYAPTLFVEDNEEHALAGSEIGHNSVLLSRVRNAGFDHPNVTRVDDWRDLAARL